MSLDPASGMEAGLGGGWFATTHWSVVLAVGHSTVPGAQEALETLCRTYWPPLYAYVRRQGSAPQEAQDITQEFFLHLLQHKTFGQADADRGKFRTFLLTSLKHFLASEWRKETCQKRGGEYRLVSCDRESAERSYAVEAVDHLSPDKLYERRWALTLMERVLARLGEEYQAAGRGLLFEKLKDCVWGDKSAVAYAQVAEESGLTESAVRVSVHRLRQRCRELLRAEIAHTVSTPGEIDDELRHLLGVFSG